MLPPRCCVISDPKADTISESLHAAEIADNPDHLADDDLAVGYNLLALDYRQLAWEILARLTKLHPPDPWTRP